MILVQKQWALCLTHTTIFLICCLSWEKAITTMGFPIQHNPSRILPPCPQQTKTLGAPSFWMPPSFPSTTSSTTLLHAVKKGGKNKKKKSPNAAGGGFGSSSSTASSLDTKVRSVSGHAGSGTKPLRAAANTFDKLRKAYGKESCNDIYIRSPLNDPKTFWFVGKIARCMDGVPGESDNNKKNDDDVSLRGETFPSIEEAVISQKRVILEYSKRELRPQNFGGKYASALELWYAPGDSEMDVVQNKITLSKVDGSVSLLSDGFHVGDVGFNPEIYVGDEIHQGGLRVQRDEDGKPIKAEFEVNQST